MSQERLQKILAHAGVSSRRAAESLITAGRVRVNGRVITELGAKADPRKDRVDLDGTRVVAEDPVYLLFHKPRGVVSTMSDPEGRLTVKDYLKGLAERVYPVGRLDFATSGVLLVTNDGEFSDGLLHPKREVPKTYVVKVSGTMTEDDLKLWSKGVELEDGITKSATVSLIRFEGDKTWIELVLKEGRNQQVRRMGEATGFPVMRLARVSFAGISSEGLRPGSWRPLTRAELHNLKQAYGVPKSLPAPAAAEQASTTRARRVAGVDARGRGRGESQDRPATAPRYGGGAPGRRGYAVTRDWGGGVERGSSSSSTSGGAAEEGGRSGRSDARRGATDSARRDTDASLGRGGRTRTTGTSGGIGASRERNDPGYRSRGRGR